MDIENKVEEKYEELELPEAFPEGKFLEVRTGLTAGNFDEALDAHQ
jgi:hypothetical protein